MASLWIVATAATPLEGGPPRPVASNSRLQINRALCDSPTSQIYNGSVVIEARKCHAELNVNILTGYASAGDVPHHPLWITFIPSDVQDILNSLNLLQHKYQYINIQYIELTIVLNMRWWTYIAVLCLLVSLGGSQDAEDTATEDFLDEDDGTTTEIMETTTVDPGPDPANPFKYYAEKQEKLLKAVSADVMEYVAPHFVKDVHELNITGDCTYGLLKFLFGLKKFRPWAIKSKFVVLILNTFPHLRHFHVLFFVLLSHYYAIHNIKCCVFF